MERNEKIRMLEDCRDELFRAQERTTVAELEYEEVLRELGWKHPHLPMVESDFAEMINVLLGPEK